MDIALLATGDEIIHGDTLNTNAYTIAHALTSEGLSVGTHLSCSDNEQDIMSCIAFLAQKHSILIITGGLGPTSDDRTRFALAKWLKLSLVELPEALTHIQARLKQCVTLAMNAGNRQQALFPKGAIIFDNPYGTAMGCSLNVRDKQFVLLPGPPRECVPMFDHFVLPSLQRVAHRNKRLMKWRLFGVAEGEMAEILDQALSHLACETGYRLETPYLEFKVRCSETLVPDIEKIIEPIIRPYIIATPNQKASERLCFLIEQLKQPIVIIDHATGGKLQTLIQQPGTYSWLNFQDQGEVPICFQLNGLDAYWLQKKDVTSAHISLTGHYYLKQISETHEIPYRSPLVVDYAAEWLCFRLSHVINQLHE